MAVSFSQTLIRNYSHRLLRSTNFSFNVAYSCYSTFPDFSMLSESETVPSSPSEALAVKIIEDAVHRLVVFRSAPDWLPLVPGASYWVPPKRRNFGVAQLLRSLSNAHLHDVDHQVLMSLITSRGWPSSDYYIQGDCKEEESSGAQIEEEDGG